jgi:SAM-dependent methyltransferase
MDRSPGSAADGYESSYREFDSPLMAQFRREAYGEDIGQHSWVGADELRADIERLGLSRSDRLLDLGCGPCGPLTFVLAAVGCRGAGVECSPAALRAGRARAAWLGVDALLSLHDADLNEPLPFAPRTFDAAMSRDVVLHHRDRSTHLREVARQLPPGGRFLLTDAGVATGAFAADEARKRSVHGHTEFVAAGRIEALLDSAGFRLIETEDRTPSVLRNATGRLAAMQGHRAELERIWGAADFGRKLESLEVAIALARRGAMSRMMYLAAVRAPRESHRQGAPDRAAPWRRTRVAASRQASRAGSHGGDTTVNSRQRPRRSRSRR